MIYDEIKEIIVEQLNADEEFITPKTNLLSDLNADSLDAVEVILAIEDKYDIEVTDDEADSLNTVQDIVNLVERKR